MNCPTINRSFSIIRTTVRKNLILVFFITTLLLLLLLPYLPALGEKLVVDNKYYSGDYWRIQDAVNNAKYGDTVYVKPGTYNETIDLKSGIILEGAGAEETKITYSGDDRVIDIYEDSDVTVSGFTLEYNGSENRVTLRIKNSSKNVVIRNNIITGSIYSGVNVGNNSSKIRIENNVIRDNKHSGVYIFGNSSAVIKGNEIYDNGYHGVSIKGETRSQIINNTIVFNGYNGFYPRLDAKPVFQNNIVVNNKDGIDVTTKSGSDGDPILGYNNVWGNEGRNYEGLDQPPTDISLDPEFVDLEGRDFNLKPTSPCIGAGKEGGDLGANPYESP